LPEAHGDFINTPNVSRTVGAGVVGEGVLEVEGMADIDPGDKVKSIIKVNAGLGPGLELAVGFGPYYSAGTGPDSHGPGDVTLSAKYKYADGTEGRPHGIVEFGTRFPTSDTGPSGRKGETDALVATTLGQAFGDYSLLGTYELGLLGDETSATVVIEHAGSLAASFRLSPQLRAFTEASMVHEPRASVTEWFGGCGAGWTISEGFELQGAVQFGLTDEAPDYMLVFGFAYELGPILPVMRGSGL
jgi:hypothetical protein